MTKRMLSALLVLATPVAFVGATEDNSSGQIQREPSYEMLRSADFTKITDVTIERLAVEDMNVTAHTFLSYENDCSGMAALPGAGFDVGVNPAPRVLQEGPQPLPQPQPQPTPVAPAPQPNPGNPSNPGVTPPRPGTPVPNPNPVPPVAQPNNPIVIIDQIINIGNKVWQMIKENRPVINAKTSYANALPRGIKCWDELEGWQRPRSELYKVAYKNGFGYEVARIVFRLVYTYGGNVAGRGQYLTNVSIQYRDLEVSWGGFEVNAGVEVPQVVNVGTKEQPVAGMQISVRWSVRGSNHNESTASFFVYGDGRPAEQLD